MKLYKSYCENHTQNNHAPYDVIQHSETPNKESANTHENNKSAVQVGGGREERGYIDGRKKSPANV